MNFGVLRFNFQKTISSKSRNTKLALIQDMNKFLIFSSYLMTGLVIIDSNKPEDTEHETLIYYENHYPRRLFLGKRPKP